MKIMMTFILFTLCLSACTNTELTSTSGLPKSWIIFQGEKYIYSTSYTTQEIKKYVLTPTEELTGEDDGTKEGLKIYLHATTNSIFINDKSNSTRPWLRYSVNKD